MSGNPLREFDIGSEWSFELLLESNGRFLNEIRFVSRYARIVTNKRQLAVSTQLKLEVVAEGDHL